VGSGSPLRRIRNDSRAEFGKGAFNHLASVFRRSIIAPVPQKSLRIPTPASVTLIPTHVPQKAQKGRPYEPPELDAPAAVIPVKRSASRDRRGKDLSISKKTLFERSGLTGPGSPLCSRPGRRNRSLDAKKAAQVSGLRRLTKPIFLPASYSDLFRTSIIYWKIWILGTRPRMTT